MSDVITFIGSYADDRGSDCNKVVSCGGVNGDRGNGCVMVVIVTRMVMLVMAVAVWVVKAMMVCMGSGGVSGVDCGSVCEEASDDMGGGDCGWW